MKPLEKPSKSLASKILTELDFDNRITGYRLHRRMGHEMVDLYSFEEVIMFLFHDLSQVKIEKLGKWVENAFGDTELSERILRLDNEEPNYMEKLIKAKNLMWSRLGQCKREIM